MRCVVAAVALVVMSVGAHAEMGDNPLADLFRPQPQPSRAQIEAAQRRQVLPSIRAASSCVAREALNELGIAQDYAQTGSILTHLQTSILRCKEELAFMMTEHDRVYGFGAGRSFFDGPYRADLERAVLARIKPELIRRKVEGDRQEEARQAEEARQQATRQAQYDAQRAEAERLEADRKREAARLNAERRAEELKASELKKQQLEIASAATAVLRNRAYDCARREISSLVRSGEGAETLATVTMTLCSGEVDKALDAMVEQARIQDDLKSVSATLNTTLKAAGRMYIRDGILAAAVKAKAAVATASTGQGL